MRLVASYHGVYDAIEFDDKWSDVHDWYERATLPIEMGGMAIRNMGVVALTAFACSFAASLRRMAVIFPELITLGPQGGFLQLTQTTPSETSMDPSQSYILRILTLNDNNHITSYTLSQD